MAVSVTLGKEKDKDSASASPAPPAWQTRPMGRIAIPLSLAFLAATIVFGAIVGGVHISPRGVLLSLLGDGAGLTSSERIILLQLRLPRVLTAGIIGAALSLSGVLLQGLFRNPMADSFVLGTSGGAAFGAAIGLLLFPQTSLLGFSATASFAFFGSLASIFAVYFLARTGGRVPVVPLLLAGLAMSILLNETCSVLYLRDELSGSGRNLALWLHGSIAAAQWRQVTFGGGILAAASILCLPLRTHLNVFALGDEYAQLLGIRVETTRCAIIAVAALLTAAAVLLGGVIGFVGLLVPHIVRLAFGPEHGRLLLLSAVFGAGYLILADAFSRSILAPTELPVGVVTAFLGGPMLLYFLRQSKREYAL